MNIKKILLFIVVLLLAVGVLFLVAHYGAWLMGILGMSLGDPSGSIGWYLMSILFAVLLTGVVAAIAVSVGYPLWAITEYLYDKLYLIRDGLYHVHQRLTRRNKQNPYI